MLYIYTLNSGLIAPTQKVIYDVDSYFDMKSSKKFVDRLGKSIMRKIDCAKIVVDDIIETPFGKTTFENLSTGCKAVLLAYLYKENKDVLINIVGCGANALSVLFELGSKFDIYVYTTGRLQMNKYKECVINDRLTTCARDFLEIIL